MASESPPSRGPHPPAAGAPSAPPAVDIVLSVAPAVAMASLYQNLAWATAQASMNAVFAQQQANIAFQAATVAAVRALLSLNED